MDYRPQRPSEYSVTVTWLKHENRWETRKFKNNKAVCYASGATFDMAMMQATILGPEADEPVDTQ
jgi:hypothetical protein